ncbi:LysR family transcriptional regulator [Phytoactinopolyspora mesophila]|uniref:LysR family transcriptional regulator n=1 Tax=Phytoactinopolyspora mesophila TaxID=2650750 RepID=A0A7K3LWV9_9ACTN|nr:LysR family transcriptional regulator [Phytoactinopolyspora mesophila]NDL55509.1 LysR family transcriptional regulator [Phytoactinopolyspora mesophila]
MANRATAMASIDDLRLVVALEKTGSLTAAAAQLHVAQPSASHRLKVLERRLGVSLFTRHATGTMPTQAGVEYLAHAKEALATVQAAADAARAAANLDRLRFGTFTSLSVPVFTALDGLLPASTVVEQHVRSGILLVADIVAGRVDGAVVALPAGRISQPGVHRQRLGIDPLVLVAPAEVPLPSRVGPTHLSRTDVVLASFSSQPDDVAQLLAQRGARVHMAGTAPIALAMARGRGVYAAIPRSCWLADRHDGEDALRLGQAFDATLSMVTGRPAHANLTGLATKLADALDLQARHRPSADR